MTDTQKSRLHAREQLLGTWVKTPSHMVCEVLGHTDLDLVCLDAEHSPFDRLELDRCLLALRAAAMPALVRVPAARPELILNALDCGASGVVLPHDKSAAMARDCVSACHFGAGGRGYAGSTRAAGYTSKAMPAHLTDSALETVVIAQIEDLEGVEDIDAIASVDGLDCLFVGRIDLTVSLGADSPASPDVVAAVEKVCLAGKAAGVPVGMFLSSVSEVKYWQARGASLFILGSDHSFLLKGAAELVAGFDQD